MQLEDKCIELEGTRARIRLLEHLQKLTTEKSPDVIPTMVTSTSEEHRLSRSEITTASMKAMGPLPLNLQLDHSSSTESAHDQAESARKSNDSTKKKPSKIPLVKSYAAPKPPGGKHSPAPGARSRSGDSLGRPHSAQSWRNKSEGNSLSGSKSNASLPKSRNTSLSNAKDSLTGKHRDSSTPTNGSYTSTNGRGGSAARKQPAPVRRTNSTRDAPDPKVRLKLAFWNWLKINGGPS